MDAEGCYNGMPEGEPEVDARARSGCPARGRIE